MKPAFKPFAVMPRVESPLYDRPMIVIYPFETGASFYPNFSRMGMLVFSSPYDPILIQPEGWTTTPISRYDWETWKRIYTEAAAVEGWILNWKKAKNNSIYHKVPAKKA